MRGALDRRLLSALSQQVRFYCVAGRGRGRSSGTPSPLPSPAIPAPKPAQSATGLGHGSGGKTAAPNAAGRGRSAGVQGSRAIGEPAPATQEAKPSPSITVSKGRGRGESPVVSARNVGESLPGKSSDASEPSGNVKANKVAPKKAAASAGDATKATQVPQSINAAVEQESSIQTGQAVPVSTGQSAVHQQTSAPQQHTGEAAAHASAVHNEAPEIFGSLIQSCVARGLIHEIDYVYSAMHSAHIPGTMHAFQTLLEAYLQLGNIQKMDMIYMEMRELRAGHKKPEATPQEKKQASDIFAALINSWYSRGFLQEVELAYRGMKACQLSVAPQTYSAVINAYNQLGNYGAADVAYRDMRAAMTPSVPQGHGVPSQTAGVQHIGQPGVAQQHGASYQPAPTYQPQQPGYYTPQQYGYSPGYPQGYPPQWPQASQVPGYPPQLNPYMQQPPTVYSHYYGQPGYPGYQAGYPPQYQPVPPTIYPPPQMGYAPPRPQQVQQVPPRPQVSPTTVTQPIRPPEQASPAVPGVSHSVRPKLELQPKALELLQQSEYSQLLKGARDRASAMEPQQIPQVHPPPPPNPQYGTVQQVPVVQHVPPPPGVVVRPVVPTQVPPLPVYPTQVPTTLHGVRPPTIQTPQVLDAKATEQVKETKMVHQQAAKTAKAEAKPVLRDVKIAAIKPEAKPPAKEEASKVVQPVTDLKPADVTPQVKPQPAPKLEVKEKPSETEPKVELEKHVEESAKPPPLKLGLKPKSAVQEAKTEEQKDESVSKGPSLKLNVGKVKPSEEKSPEVPKSPSLKLDLKKKTQEEPTSTLDAPRAPALKLGLKKPAQEEIIAEVEAPKTPALKLGLKKPVEKPEEESLEASDVSETEREEVTPALPSIRKLSARGRGKGGPKMDPIGSMLGIHAPVDDILQQQDDLDLEAIAEESAANLPALPFESRRGKGRGKALPVVNPAEKAAEEKRLRQKREEAAARAIAILESGLGKSQMSVYLERRKKRFSDQQFSLGMPSRSSEMTRTGGLRKGKDSSKKMVQGEIDYEGAIEYVAPEEYMMKGDPLSEVEEAVKGTLHRHFMLDIDPEAAMEEFGTNPDIDEKPLPTLEQTLDKAKEKLIAEDGIDEKEWEEAVEDVKKRAPQLQSLVQRYTGPAKKNAKQNNKELHEIVSQLPPFAPPELAAFAKRAMVTLQNNPNWSQHNKERLLHRLVFDTKRIVEGAGTSR